MSASACSSWPTPSASLTNDGESAESWQARAEALRAKGINGNGAGMPLTIASKMWATPQAHDTKTGNPDRVGRFGTAAGGRNLADEAMLMWPTPLSTAGRQGENKPDGKRGRPLVSVVREFWPTVSARDWKGAPDNLREENARPLNEVAKLWRTPAAGDTEVGPPATQNQLMLANQARTWGTPSTVDAQGRAYTRDQGKKGSERLALGGQAISHFTHLDPESAISGPPSSAVIPSSLRRYLATTDSVLRAEMRALIRMSISARKAGWCRAYQRPCERRQLNALFAEWLMGWPRGWTRVPTVLGSQAMGFTLWLRRQRTALSTLSWSYAPAPGAEPEMQQMELL